jgi:hypothetical protein
LRSFLAVTQASDSRVGKPLDANRQFHDPLETTDSKYNALQTDKEIFVDSVLERVNLLADNRIYQTHQSERAGLTNKLVTLEESVEKRHRFIRDADDFVRCLAIEFEIELGFRLAIIPVGKLFEFAPPQWPIRKSGAFDGVLTRCV